MRGMNWKRRGFLKAMGGGVGALLMPRGPGAWASNAAPRPNALWISTEDISPNLGCYGDAYAVTPNLDRFAGEGVRFENCFATAGVCAPARSGIITGMYPSAIGTNQMRCKGVPPPEVRCFPEYLRAAGYYCTNRSKTDYQFDPPPTAWDQNGRGPDWRGRAPGQPFFSVINITTTHEGQIRNETKGMHERLATLGPDERHDPAKASLPPYYADTPTVRRDWARHADLITLMDKEVARILDDLEADGLAEETIVWFWGDHGRGLPRAKRWIYDSGLHVPLLVRVPEKFRKLANPGNPSALAPGSVHTGLVSFIDFGPAVLSLAGVPLPKHLHGRAFLGRQTAEPRKYVFAARDRMDEAYDLIRAVRDKRFKYIRNFMPHLTYGQDIAYMNQMPTMREMRRLHAEGKLEGPETHYFRETKPVEELYDTNADPHEIHNLADNPQYAADLRRLRERLLRWMRETGDVGLIPEPEFDEMKRPGGEYERVAPPAVFLAQKTAGGSFDVYLKSHTPGSSVLWRYEKPSGDGKWRLYTAPFPLQEGRALQAKACRLGFRDSDIADCPPGSSDDAWPAPDPGSPDRPHWRVELDRTDLLERLLALKLLDGKGAAAIPRYYKALEDADGPVRYWAAVGLHTACTSPGEIAKASRALEKLLRDPSPSVPIATAQALCDWGRADMGLPVLTAALESPREKVRLFAITALGRLGKKARPAVARVRAATKDKANYVARRAQSALRGLGETSGT